jgi:hypothetical protein
MRATMTTAATATTATVDAASIIALSPCGYAEKRPRPRKPTRANTTTMMRMIQRSDM